MTAPQPAAPGSDSEACGICGFGRSWHEGGGEMIHDFRPAAPSEPVAGGVHPAEIVRQRAIGWPDFHPEDFCHQCGRPNPTWFADTAEWQAATGSTGDGGGILCPSCFAALYRRVTGRDAIIWRLSVDPRSRDAAPPPATDSPTPGTPPPCTACGYQHNPLAWCKANVCADCGLGQHAGPDHYDGCPAAPSPVDTTEPPAEAQRESVQPRAHRDAAGVLWVPVEVDPVWVRLAARPSADTETLLADGYAALATRQAQTLRRVRDLADEGDRMYGVVSTKHLRAALDGTQ